MEFTRLRLPSFNIIPGLGELIDVTRLPFVKLTEPRMLTEASELEIVVLFRLAIANGVRYKGYPEKCEIVDPVRLTV